MDPRLPTHVEVDALIRRTQAEGGFAAVLQKGHQTAGTILLVLTHNGRNARAYERMPQIDGTREWVLSRNETPEKQGDFQDYLVRRGRQDDDLWIVELDIADAERLVGLSGTVR